MITDDERFCMPVKEMFTAVQLQFGTIPVGISEDFRRGELTYEEKAKNFFNSCYVRHKKLLGCEPRSQLVNRITLYFLTSVD